MFWAWRKCLGKAKVGRNWDSCTDFFSISTGEGRRHAAIVRLIDDNGCGCCRCRGMIRGNPDHVMFSDHAAGIVYSCIFFDFPFVCCTQAIPLTIDGFKSHLKSRASSESLIDTLQESFVRLLSAALFYAMRCRWRFYHSNNQNRHHPSNLRRTPFCSCVCVSTYLGFPSPLPCHRRIHSLDFLATPSGFCISWSY